MPNQFYALTALASALVLLPSCKSREYNSSTPTDVAAPVSGSRRICGLALRASKDRDALMMRVTVPSKMALEDLEGKTLKSRLVGFRLPQEELAGVESSPRMKSDLLTCFDGVNVLGDGSFEGRLVFPSNTPQRPVAVGCGSITRVDNKYLLRLPDPGSKVEFLGVPLRAIDQGTEETLHQALGNKVCLVGDPFWDKGIAWLAVDKLEIRKKPVEGTKAQQGFSLSEQTPGELREVAKNKWSEIIRDKEGLTAGQKRHWISDMIVEIQDYVVEAKFKVLEGEQSRLGNGERDQLSVNATWAEGKLDACCEAIDKLEE